MKTKLARLNNHFILCGFGRVGKETALAFKRESVQFIVVDRDASAIAEADARGFAYVQGDATRDETLQSASIERARGLVAAAGNDGENVFITLTARGLNPNLVIVARATHIEAEDKLLRAGASTVISPLAVGGRRMALSAVRPLAVDFFDTIIEQSRGGGLRLAEVQVLEDSPLAGATVDECCSPRGVQVLAIRKHDGGLLVSPGSSAVIEPGDGLVLVGTDAQLHPLEGQE